MANNSQDLSLLIYIPALNEEKTIHDVIKKLPQKIEGVGKISCLVIDDGSKDRTAEIAKEAGVVVLSHSKNFGLGIAFRNAVRYSLENDFDILVGIDADNQFDPAEIPRLITDIIDEKASMVIGNRFNRGRPKNMPIIKYWGNFMVATLLNFFSDEKLRDVSCGYRAYSREVLLHMNLFGIFSYTHESILSIKLKGLNIKEYPIKVTYFEGRRSRLATSILNYFVQSSIIIFRVLLDFKPIMVFGLPGLLSILISVIFGVYLLLHFFNTGAYTPYKAYGFFSLGFAIIGFLLLLIGLLADMVNRIRLNQEKMIYQLKRIIYDKKKLGK